MAHQIYLTEGIIIKKRDFGEADRLFWIYTEKFGMIMTSAKGVRLEKSKLRGGLHLFSYGKFALISSREFWKIVDAQDICHAKNIELAGKFSGIAGLLLRMIKGQERNNFLWQELKGLFLALFKNKTEEKDLKDLEINFNAKILRELGYVADLPKTRKEIISAINRAIKESML